MAIRIASLLVDMQANVARLQSDMNRASNIVEHSTNQMQRSLRRITNLFTLGLGATALVRGVGSLVKAAKEAEASEARLTATINAQGHAAGFTRLQLEAMNDELVQMSQFDDEGIRSAQAELIKFGNIHGDVFRDALKLSADYAAFTGSDMPDAAQKLGLALTALEFGRLQRDLGKLTDAQEASLKTMRDYNDVAGAQAVILDIVRGKIAGTANLMNRGYTKAVADAAKAWDNFKEAVANVPAGQGVLGSFFKFLTDSLTDIAAILERGTWLDSLMFLLGFRGGGISAVAPHAREFAALNEELLKLDQRIAGARGMTGGADPATDAFAQMLKRREEILKRINAIQDEGAVKPTLGPKKFMGDALPGHNRNLLGIGEDFFAQAQLSAAFGAVNLDKQRQTVERANELTRMKADGEAFGAEQLGIYRDAQRAATDSMEVYIKSIESETRLMGTTTSGRQRLLDIMRLEEEQRDLNAKGVGFAAEEYERLIAKLQAARDAQDALNASWAFGAGNALAQYTDTVENVASSTERLVTDAFRGMEDALVEFVKTGKLSFRSLAESIVSDMIRIQIQQSITGPLAGFITGIIPGVSAGGTTIVEDAGFGGQNIQARAAGGPMSAGMPYIVGEAGPELFVPRAGGSIVPNGAAGGSVTINQNIHIDSRSDQATILLAMTQAKEAAKAEIRNEFYRGGRVAVAAGTR